MATFNNKKISNGLGVQRQNLLEIEFMRNKERTHKLGIYTHTFDLQSKN